MYNSLFRSDRFLFTKVTCMTHSFIDPYSLAESLTPGYVAKRPSLSFECANNSSAPVLVTLQALLESHQPQQLCAVVSRGKIISLRS